MCCPVAVMITEPMITSNGDGNLGNDDVISVPENDMRGGTQLIGHPAVKCDNPNPHTLGEHCDTEEEREDHVIQSNSGSTNALELLMGQYHDSDSELEPGEVI